MSQLGLPFDAYVAPLPGQPEPSGPLPLLAPGPWECEQLAGNIAGVPADRVLCRPARDWSDELMSLLEAANRRAENEIRELEALHAKILGCSVEELRARQAKDAAEERARRLEARAARPRKERAPKGKPGPIALGQRALTERQQELLSHLRVESNVAVYQPDERIADWAELKAIMTALGGTWKTGGKGKKGGFRFPDDADAQELVRLALETGEILDPKAADLFETPDDLADDLAQRAELEPGMIVLEPSAGRGAIVRALVRACPQITIQAVEPLDQNIAGKLATSHHGIRNGGLNILHGSFEHVKPGDPGFAPFDRVVMNPPFSRRQDITHIRHAFDFLRPGGKLVAVASAGVQFRDDAKGKDFRAFVKAHGGTIEPLPEGSFKASGTMVRTVVVTLRGGHR